MNTKNKTIMIKEKHAGKHLKQAKKALNSLDFEKARIEFERAFNMNPKYEMIYEHFVALLDVEDGVKVYTKAIEINPEFAEFSFSRGLLYETFLEDDEKALEDFNRAISLDSKNYTYFETRGNLFKRLERYDDAILDYKNALKLNGKLFDMLTELGICFFFKKDFKSATKCFKRTIYKSKNNQAIGKAYKYLGYTSIEKEEDISNAVNYFKKSIEFYEKTPFSHEAPYGDLEFIYKNIDNRQKS